MATYIFFWNPDISNFTKDYFNENFGCDPFDNWSIYEHDCAMCDDEWGTE